MLRHSEWGGKTWEWLKEIWVLVSAFVLTLGFWGASQSVFLSLSFLTSRITYRSQDSSWIMRCLPSEAFSFSLTYLARRQGMAGVNGFLGQMALPQGSVSKSGPWGRWSSNGKGLISWTVKLTGSVWTWETRHFTYHPLRVWKETFSFLGYSRLYFYTTDQRRMESTEIVCFVCFYKWEKTHNFLSTLTVKNGLETWRQGISYLACPEH